MRKITKNKKGISTIYEMMIHIIIVALLFALLYFGTMARAGTRGVKQQVVEKEVALLIDSASPGMSFSLTKVNMKGVINDMQIKDGRVFAYVDGLGVSKGYPYFTKYSVSLEKNQDSFKVVVK